MISFGFWIAGLLGKTVTTAQARKLGLWVGLPLAVIGLVLLAWGGKALYDSGIRQQAQQQRDGQAAQQLRKADEEADAALANHAAAVEDENERLSNAVAAAKAEANRPDPVTGERPVPQEVGPVQQSYFDNLPKKGK